MGNMGEVETLILQKSEPGERCVCVERNHHGSGEASFIQGRSERAFVTRKLRIVSIVEPMT